MSVKTATFNGVVYDITMCEQEINGLCDYPRSGKPSIVVMTEPYTCKELKVILHETLHASDWSKSEEIIVRISEEQSRLLWRLGYRRMGQ